MSVSIVLIVISSFGLHLAALIGFYLVFSRKYRNLANQLLGLLLIALAIRTGKAIFYNFLELPAYIKNLALAANLAAAPLLYFYGKALLQQEFKWRVNYGWHFVPALFYAGFCTVLPSEPLQLWWKVTYGFILLQSYVYVGLTSALVVPAGDHPNQFRLGLLVVGLGFMWLIYGLVFLGVFPYHIAGSISFSVLMVLLAIVVFNRIPITYEKRERYQQSKYTEQQLREYHTRITRGLDEQELYLQTDLTVERLAIHLDLSPRIISETINRLEDQNFTSFINNYRIAKAQALLNQNPKLKIAAIAYDCGFNSLSAFNQAFKTQTDYTPSQFRALQAK